MRRKHLLEGATPFFGAIVAAGWIAAFEAVADAGIPDTSGSSIGAAQYQYDKVTICHVAGRSGNRVTITVAASAVPAHRAHGDTLGPCP